MTFRQWSRLPGWTNRVYSNPAICLEKCVRKMSSIKPIYDYSILDKGDQTICLAREKVGLKPIPKYILKRSSIFLYESCTDKVDVSKFINELHLDDSFTVWFCVTRLHLWILFTRLMNEKVNGSTLRNETISRMWEDCQHRMNKLAHIKQKEKKKVYRIYQTEFNATLFGLDEGLLLGDVVLAGGLWRNFFGKSSQIDPIYLELLVAYTRTQVDHLSHINFERLVLKGDFDWKSFPPLMK